MAKERDSDELDPANDPAGDLPVPADGVGGAGGTSSARGHLRTSALIALLCFLVYNANFRSISAGDTYPARYLPFAILNHRTIDLAPLERVAKQGRGGGAYWLLRLSDGRLVSLYPIVTPLLVTPLYVPAVALLRATGWNDARLDYVARVMEKLAASVVAALSVALLYLLLRRRGSGTTALVLTLAYALGTTTWVISSQALWQHGMAQLLLVGAMLLLTAPPSATTALGAGLLVGLVAANRPPDTILAAALGACGLVLLGRKLGAILAASAAMPMLATLAYNLRVFGHVAGGYGTKGKDAFLEHDMLEGLGGLLVSPARGLLVFSPFLVFLLLAFFRRPRGRDERWLTVAIATGVVLQTLLYAVVDWRSGLSWGPRYLTDAVPLLVWMLVPVVETLRGAARALFSASVLLSIAIQGVGAFCYAQTLDLPLFARDRGWTHELGPAWKWANSPIVSSWRAGPAPRELTVEVRGGFDGVESTGRVVTEVRRGDAAWASGWALAGDAAPWQVAVTIDGSGAVATHEFLARGDVGRALRVATPSGWRIKIDTSTLAPGAHRLDAFAWVSERGEARFLGERTLTIGEDRDRRAGVEGERGLPADLREASAIAAAKISDHLQPDGYWLTRHTTVTRYVEPVREMNTYLTALMVDLLGRAGGSAGLADDVARAKEHLTRQIEPGGLVRYHGLPDGPGIGTLGCAITPDTDDTALAWRLAPARDRGRLTGALATIERYRRPDGLYRTWLAPREGYQCLDPGRDPNPADLVIQMHLLQLLAEAEPAKGRALCEAMRPHVDDDGAWAYYRKAPLVAILRLADLRRAGCALELPEARMRTEIAGQQIWVALVRMLDGADRGGERTPDAALARAVLRELARDDFALVKTDPPLLYHNDLTATVPRYYWSEDVGYALWLRLYDEYGQARDPRAGE